MMRRSVLAAIVALVLLLPLGVAPAVATPSSGAVARSALGASGRAVLAIRVIGHTVKGRPIRAFHLGQRTATRKVVLMGAIHGDEAAASGILTNLMGGAPISGADIWVLPYFNRDGVARHTRKNARGVDLNRNFPVNWRRQFGKYYSGRAPASEPETRALMRFLRKIDPSVVVSLHQPLNGVDTSYGKARSYAVRLAGLLGLPTKVFNCNGGCHGTMTQWFSARRPGLALTVEYGARISQRQATVTGPTGLLRSVGARR